MYRLFERGGVLVCVFGLEAGRLGMWEKSTLLYLQSMVLCVGVCVCTECVCI